MKDEYIFSGKKVKIGRKIWFYPSKFEIFFDWLFSETFLAPFFCSPPIVGDFDYSGIKEIKKILKEGEIYEIRYFDLKNGKFLKIEEMVK